VGTDDFTILGTKTGGAYDQFVTGTETYTLVDSGNPVTGHYEREIDVDSSSHTRSSTGAGAEEPSDSGSTDYHWEQTGTGGKFQRAVSVCGVPGFQVIGWAQRFTKDGIMWTGTFGVVRMGEGVCLSSAYLYQS
jgi:hypothetical protein